MSESREQVAATTLWESVRDLTDYDETIAVLARALAACALEARLDEAEWWEQIAGDEHGPELASECAYCQRLLKLRQAVELERAVEGATNG